MRPTARRTSFPSRCFRELGPLVSAIVLTGFAGASIAAEIGTMVVSEEIEALEAEAISPMRFLVLPRVLATTVMMVCVAVVGDLMGVSAAVSPLGCSWASTPGSVLPATRSRPSRFAISSPAYESRPSSEC